VKANVFCLALVGLLTACPILSQVKAGSIYRWVDAKGGVHYGDKPAPSIDNPKSESAIDKADLNVGDNPEAQKKLANDIRNSAQKKREAGEAEVAAKELASKDLERQKACTAAKSVVKTYSDGGRIASVNEKGERIVLDDKEVSTKRDEAIKAMDEICAPAPSTPVANPAKK